MRLFIIIIIIYLFISIYFQLCSGRDFWTRMEIAFYLALSEINFCFAELLFVDLVPNLSYLVAYSTVENKL